MRQWIVKMGMRKMVKIFLHWDSFDQSMVSKLMLRHFIFSLVDAFFCFCLRFLFFFFFLVHVFFIHRWTLYKFRGILNIRIVLNQPISMCETRQRVNCCYRQRWIEIAKRKELKHLVDQTADRSNFFYFFLCSFPHTCILLVD